MSREPEPKSVIKESWTGFLLPIALIFGLVLLLSLNTNVGGSVGEGTQGNPLEGWLNLSSATLRQALKLRRPW